MSSEENIMPYPFPRFPIQYEDKFFHHYDDETGEETGPPTSLKDFDQQIMDIGGINEDLLGAYHNI